MKTLKALGLLTVGGGTALWLLAKGVQMNTNYPREGSVVFEDDKIKVTRVTTKSSGNVDLATIVYKKKED